MIEILSSAGKVCSRSRNLRGVLTYARKHNVKMVLSSMTDHYGALVTIHFGDDAKCITNFASWDVAQRWFRARRSWGLTVTQSRPTFESFEPA